MSTTKQLCLGGCGKTIHMGNNVGLCYECSREAEFNISEFLNPVPIKIPCCICHTNYVNPSIGQDTCEECSSKM